MNQRRKLFYKTLGRWWILAAMENYDWGQPDSDETLEAEEALWESKELYENGDIKLSDVRPVFERWVKTHQKLELEHGRTLPAAKLGKHREATI